eukprot:Platyproteum_vivax@DN4181_c0_g1_i1.p1
MDRQVEIVREYAQNTIPGYTGWMPCKYSEDLYGKTYAAENITAANKFQDYLYNKNRSRRSTDKGQYTPKNNPAGGDTFDAIRGPYAANNVQTLMSSQPSSPQGGHAGGYGGYSGYNSGFQSSIGSRSNSPLKIPGYSGHVPRKDAENILGCTFTRAADIAANIGMRNNPSMPSLHSGAEMAAMSGMGQTNNYGGPPQDTPQQNFQNQYDQPTNYNYEQRQQYEQSNQGMQQQQQQMGQTNQSMGQSMNQSMGQSMNQSMGQS